MLRDYPAHDCEQVFASPRKYERVLFIRPGEFKAGGKRRNPDFTDWRVGRNDETSRFWFFKNNFEFAAFSFHVKIVNVSLLKKALLQLFEQCVGFFLEFVF